jgi:hypothetical protein
MNQTKVVELEQKIRQLASQLEYTTSMIALCMAEANLLDEQISVFSSSGLLIRKQIRDLKAELKDTI